MVGVNVPIPVPISYHGFGGAKRSAFGDHDWNGIDGVRFFTRPKKGTVRWATGESTGAVFSFPIGDQ